MNTYCVFILRDKNNFKTLHNEICSLKLSFFIILLFQKRHYFTAFSDATTVDTHKHALHGAKEDRVKLSVEPGLLGPANQRNLRSQ